MSKRKPTIAENRLREIYDLVLGEGADPTSEGAFFDTLSAIRESDKWRKEANAFRYDAAPHVGEQQIGTGGSNPTANREVYEKVLDKLDAMAEENPIAPRVVEAAIALAVWDEDEDPAQLYWGGLYNDLIHKVARYLHHETKGQV